VPSVIGRSEADARDLLAAVGLRVTATPVSMDGPDAAGTVVATSPAPGDVTTPGASVALTVASGFETVPDVRGMTADRAQYEVASAGFAIALQRAPSEVVPAGTVMEVDPAVGTRAAHGSRVTLVVSTGPAASAPTPAPTSAAPSATPSPETTAEAQR
jgi:serine/threonine-protein kinase